MAMKPLDQIRRRAPEQGRIRLGHRTGARNKPEKLETLRFTSPDRKAIEQIAELYGGTAEPWDDPGHPNEWQVYSEATEIPVVLPPDPLYGPVYELWSRGGLQRRCDGTTTLVPREQGPNGEREYVPEPCICNARQKDECSAKIRLKVILRDIRFGGIWLLTSSGWNANEELPGMVELIMAMQERGLPAANLRMVERVQTRFGKTRRFIVPVLTVDSSVQQIVAGENTLTGVTAPSSAAALEAGSIDPDDDVAEGEIEVPPEAVIVLSEQVAVIWNEGGGMPEVTGLALAQYLAAQISGDEGATHVSVTNAQRSRICDLLEDILDGRMVITRIENRRVKVRRAEEPT